MVSQRLYGKPGNDREFGSCRGTVTGKILSGETAYWQYHCFDSRVVIAPRFRWRISVMHYYTVDTVRFGYFIVSVHEMDNCSTSESASASKM